MRFLKKNYKLCGYIKKKCIFATSKNENVQWCNGSTTVFGTVCLGSNPGWTTKKNSHPMRWEFFLKEEKEGAVVPSIIYNSGY